MPNKIAELVEIRCNGHIEKTNHHLVVRLLAPAHGRLRVRVMGIVARIIVPGDGLQFGAGFQQTRFREG